MKTRIISGIVMAALVAVVLTLGFVWSSWVITVFVGILAMAAVYELLHNAAKIDVNAAITGAAVYAFTGVVLFDEKITQKAQSLQSAFTDIVGDTGSTSYWKLLFVLAGVLYLIYAVVVILKFHGEFSLGKIMAFVGSPFLLSAAFGSLANVINHTDGLYYILMLLNLSCVCDTGAYFVGVTMGKHKLCPEISPKKTVEGAIGGIVSSLVVGFILLLVFGRLNRAIPTLILTVVLCIIGMLGDLFASSIKRSVGIKDYSNLIPGHGGILDRLDSILLISPVFYLYIMFGVI